MYAVLILGCFLVTILLRKKLHKRELQVQLHKLHAFNIPLAAILQPWVFFLAVMVGVYISMLVAFSSLMRDYAWLDPEAIELPDLNATSAGKDAGAYEIPFWLRCLSVVSPATVGFTFLITVGHLWLHLPRNRGFDEDIRWFPSFSHDLAMQVAALPLVYGIFGLGSMVQMLELLTGRAYATAAHGKHLVGPAAEAAWAQAVGHVERTYHTNFELADLYEAWALRSFGKLCFTIVSRQVRLEVPTVQYIIDTVRSHLSSVAAAESRDVGVLNDLMILSNPQKLLYEPLKQTSYIGIRVFVLTYAFKSVYLLSLGILSDPPFSINMCGDTGVLPAFCSLTQYLDGAAFLASTLAIYNLVVFEHTLKDILSRDRFRPFEKFLGVKAMVSIAFMQTYGLEVVMGNIFKFASAQINLCYACLICLEVLPLSLLVLVAWKPSEGDWFVGDNWSRAAGCEVELARGQLADEDAVTTDELAFIASRQPTAGLTSRPAIGDELTAVIELRGNVQAKEGKAMEDVINALSKTVRAQYKPAALYRCRTSEGRGW